MSREIRQKLASKLRELRKQYGFTQEKLAELSGVDYKHIQLLESNDPSGATIDTLEKLAKAFDLSIAELIDFK